MNEEKIRDAVDYANGSNRLEGNDMTTQETDQIVRSILKGSSDESFIIGVVNRFNEQEKQKEERENNNVKTRK